MAKLRMAEHMLLEAKNHGLVPYTRLGQSGNRCALGLVGNDRDWCGSGAEDTYPWLLRISEACPCECDPPNLHDGYVIYSLFITACYSNYGWVIAHLFNEHVMQGGKANPGAKPWTLEQLADWIDSVDPTPRTAEDEVSELSDSSSLESSVPAQLERTYIA